MGLRHSRDFESQAPPQFDTLLTEFPTPIFHKTWGGVHVGITDVLTGRRHGRIFQN